MPGAGTNPRVMTAEPTGLKAFWRASRLRWKRRYFLARAIRRRRQLAVLHDRTARIEPGAILLFSTMRNEAMRLPHFLAYYRALGVDHFLIVDNDSDDGTAELLGAQADVSLWRSGHSYKAARFGIDWLTYLQFRHGSGHWCLTVDADELLVFTGIPRVGLADLTGWLDDHRMASMGAVMIDLFPRGRLDEGSYSAGADPLDQLCWFDADNFFSTPRPELESPVLRGGVRLRAFFADRPERAPTMNKVPLVRWHWRYAYMTSTHVILPTALNRTDDPARPRGALLHTKFLPGIARRAQREKARGEHFSNSPLYDQYYDMLASGDTLWRAQSTRFQGWDQLVALGLARNGGFADPKSRE